jgi:acyl dehydratase
MQISSILIGPEEKEVNSKLPVGNYQKWNFRFIHLYGPQNTISFTAWLVEQTDKKSASLNYAYGSDRKTELSHR